VVGAAVVAGLAGVVAVLWVHVPALYASTPVEHGWAQAVALTRTGILTAGAALLALAGVLLNLLENRRNTNLTHTRELAEQAEARRANDLTHTRELYTAAVGQLGSDTLDVRLGGVYALERIATDSAADHRTVVEVLSAFVREHTTPGRPGTARRSSRHAVLPTPAERAGGATRTPARLDTDIQAALTVLGRLPTQAGVCRADLTGAHLGGAQLVGADLSGVRLGEVTLTGAYLFGRANLSGAWLYGADLSGAVLLGADLSGAQLSEADLTDAKLGAANLSGAQLGKTTFSGAQLYVANLNGAYLGGTDISRAIGLTQKQLDVTYGNGTTKLPAELARPVSWPEEEPFD
jgi:uncharacterized protein YjbI with pentapeptide repeats